jgi:hypothetical protein
MFSQYHQFVSKFNLFFLWAPTVNTIRCLFFAYIRQLSPDRPVSTVSILFTARSTASFELAGTCFSMRT